nr:MBL fold metallo-hydrolase [Patulibacter sp. SYSU D01012]
MPDGVNVHLVRGDGPTTLVDAGMPLPGALEALRAGLAAAGAALDDVQRVVLTHHHADHIGLAAAIAARTGAELVALAPVAAVLRDPGTAFGREVAWAGGHVARHGAPDEVLERTRASLPVLAALPAASAVTEIADGDVVAAGGLRLTARHRPGHSPTDTLLTDAAAGVAFVGDHLFRAAPLTPVLGSMLAPGARPARAYLDALDATLHDGVPLLLPGHGPPIADPAALVADRLGAYRRRTERALAALTDAPASTWQVGLGAWRGAPGRALALTRLAALLASLELLEDEGRAVRSGTDDAVLWARGPRADAPLGDAGA